MYGVGEVVRGARDAEDAVKRFKADPEGTFVRPIVSQVQFFGMVGIVLVLWIGGHTLGLGMLTGCWFRRSTGRKDRL